MRKSNRKQTPKTNKLQKKITVIGLIANMSTDGARKLLKQYGKEDAVNHEDLEYKLSELYATVDDKMQLEQELAEIHPHRELILNYLAPAPIETPLEETLPDVAIKEIAVEEVKPETKSNCSGCSAFSNCSGSNGSKESNACGCSNASGSTTVETPQAVFAQPRQINDIAIVAMFGIIVTLALVISKK